MTSSFKQRSFEQIVETAFISRWFPSSKQCHMCGSINKELNLSDRSWQCGNCNTNHDRDLNAALNLAASSVVSARGGNVRPQNFEAAPRETGRE